MSRAGTRLALRMMRRRNRDQREQISAILNDSDKLELMEDELAAKSYGGERTDSPMDWFTWLIDNWETVFKVIQMIILVMEKEGETA